MRAQMSTTMILDYLGISIDSDAAQDLSFIANVKLADTNENYVLVMKNGILLYKENTQEENPDVTWTTTRQDLGAMMLQSEDGPETREKTIQQEGDTDLLEKMCSFMSSYDWFFNIIEP